MQAGTHRQTNKQPDTGGKERGRRAQIHSMREGPRQEATGGRTTQTRELIFPTISHSKRNKC